MNPLVCFHCDEPLLGSTLTAWIGGRNEAVCCQGCRAVAELIGDIGLGDYYRFRQVSAARPAAPSLATDTWEPYARDEVATQFTRRAGEHDSVTLAIDGIRCPACSWLIDKVLLLYPGVVQASTNAATGRTSVSWKHSCLTLADVMRTIASLGYRPCALSDDSVSQLQLRERREALKRMAVAGFGMMQVMMFAVAAYSAQISGDVIEPGLAKFFRLLSLLVATPVLAYAGAPILAGAWHNLRSRSVGMDVPVALALLLAYGASAWNTLHGNGAVYFDSVTMFVFFLTLGRFVQMSVRHRMTGLSDALARQLPAYAHRVEATAVLEVPVTALRRDDLVLVRAGEVIPVDGVLQDSEGAVDESILTGESMPVRRSAGDRVAAGTLNSDQPVYIRVTETASGTLLAQIIALLQRAQAQRPALARSADAAAARFLRLVLFGAAVTFSTWMVLEPGRAFEATLAVLVVACPCAFAIATPAAFSAAVAKLAHIGVLVTRPDALETLAAVDEAGFDKTGTLTRGTITVDRCVALGDVDATKCLQIATALELSSEHPLARAFGHRGDPKSASAVVSVPGCGIEGVVGGRRYRIGSSQFVGALHSDPDPPETYPPADELAGTIVFLGDEETVLALFELVDTVRPEAAAAVAALRELRVHARVLSGDGACIVAAVAADCGISEYFSRQSPEQKLAHVRNLQRQGHRVVMIGDGVNDAPVLAAADVSIAMGRGAALAHASADMILINENLGSLGTAVRVSRRMQHIARQNRIWSALYNIGSLPLAAAGLIPPWLAALGMSISSIIVLLNSARLLPRKAGSDRGDDARLQPGNNRRHSGRNERLHRNADSAASQDSA